MSSAMATFSGHRRQARVRLCLLVLVTVGFSAERWYLGSKLGEETKVIVIDEGTYYLPKALDFADAKDLHVSQAVLAVESLYSRHPGGSDHQKRLKRLFNKAALRDAAALFEAEADEFQVRQIHQKVEPSSVMLMEAKGRIIRVKVEGQLIRSGIFAGRPFVETLRLECHITFLRNPAMLVNGGFPTIVQSFESTTTPTR